MAIDQIGHKLGDKMCLPMSVYMCICEWAKQKCAFC